MTKVIELTQGCTTIVDDEDFDTLSLHKWRAHYNGANVYAQAWIKIEGKWKTISLHSMLLPPNPGWEVDHINRNSLDNRRSNLRYLLHKHNTHNRRIPSNNTSGYYGVSWNGATNKWQAQITAEGKNHYLGVFVDKIEAAKAYDKCAREVHGEFATLNFPSC